MDLNEAVKERRSIRKFRRDPVPEDVIDRLIESACLAPSASNLQAWRFIVVNEPALVRKVDLFCPGLSGEPPVIIVIASDLAEVERRGSENSLRYGCMMDASMAAENLMLAAVSYGLGTCAIKSYNDAAVRKILQLPETIRIELLVSLGVPEATPKTPPRKPLEQVRTYNRWKERETE